MSSAFQTEPQSSTVIKIERDAAIRILRYLGTKPYSEVVEVCTHLQKTELPHNLLIPTLNYMLRDDGVYSFAYLKKILDGIENESNVSTNTPNTADEDNIAQ